MKDDHQTITEIATCPKKYIFVLQELNGNLELGEAMNSKSCQSYFLLAFSVFLISNLSARDLNSWQTFKKSKTQEESHHTALSATIINWPTFFGVQQTDEIIAGFDCFGTFGLNYSPVPLDSVWPQYSFATPAIQPIEYLYGGAIWIGGILGDDTLVSLGHDGWFGNTEFRPSDFGKPKSRGSVNEFDYGVTDFSMRAEFTDTSSKITLPEPYPRRQLNLKIANRSHSWSSGLSKNLVIYDLVATNIGNDLIENGYLGFFFDCDVGRFPEESPFDDLAGSLKEHQIAYMIDNNGDYEIEAYKADRIFAFKLLASSILPENTNFNWWTSNGDVAKDYGPRLQGTPENPFRDFGTGGLGTPIGDRNKYYVMSFPEWDFDQIEIHKRQVLEPDSSWVFPSSLNIGAQLTIGADSRILISMGPFQLSPDSSIRVLYVTFTGSSVLPSFNNIGNLPEDPEEYISNLSFDEVIATANTADSLAQLLLDPTIPPLGLKLVHTEEYGFELEWDPWVFENVSGYSIYIHGPSLDTLPQPGAIPPWWTIPDGTAPEFAGKTHRYSINHLDSHHYYLAAVANGTGEIESELSAPISFNISGRKPAPEFATRFAFSNPEMPLMIEWFYPDKSNVDHFNIYKFPDSTSAEEKYHRFYDNGYFAQFEIPDETYEIAGKTYYYYAMEPYATVPNTDTFFFDSSPLEGEIYVVTTVDADGFESEFSINVETNIVEPMTRDILLIANSIQFTPSRFVYWDSVRAFYNNVLSGLDYDIYSHIDTIIHNVNCPDDNIRCMDWHDFMRYKMLIVDDYFVERILDEDYERLTSGFERYLTRGGKLVYFGRFYGFESGFGADFTTFQPLEHKFINEFMGIDSLKFNGNFFYYPELPPVDSLFGFIDASVLDGSLPPMRVDTVFEPFTPRYRIFWTPRTPMYVATFKISPDADAALSFNSIRPFTSFQQDEIVGVRKDLLNLNTQVYTFGFHLWYMDTADARNLIGTLFNATPNRVWARTSIEPNEFHIADLFQVEPKPAVLYIGNLGQGRSVQDIIPASVLVNEIIVPTSIEIIPFLEGYDNEVLKLEIPMRDLILPYYPLWGILNTKYKINANFTDNLGLEASANYRIKGKLRGDINDDELVGLVDLNLMVGYLFRGLPLPEFSEPADCNMDGKVNILDLSRLVNYVFRGGLI